MIAGCAPAPAVAPTEAPAAPAAPAAGGSAKGKVMGIVMPNADHGFTGESIAHAQAYVKTLAEKEGFTYQFLTAGETSEQNNQIDTLINQKVDVIVMWPINGDELRSAAQKVVDAKIPLVIYDRLITGFTPTVEFMGDNVTIGKMAGEYFNKFFKADIDAGKDINILEFKGDLSTVPTQRSDGFKSTASPKFKILQSFTTNWQRATAMDQMETFLNTSSQADIESVKAVFTHDDEVVLGVLDAIAAYKGAAKLDIRLVSGVGARKENLDTFADFKTKHSIDQVTYAFSPAMIDSAVQLGDDILNGKTPSGLILGPTVEVDNSSAEAFRTNPIYITRYSLSAPAAPAATEAPAAPAAGGAKGKTMGIVMPNADHGFTGESIAHAQYFAKQMAEKEGFTYQFLTAGETSEQNNQVDTLINQKVDVIVMWPINGDELRSAAQKIVDAKIPLVIYDRLITGFTPTVEFMGDNVIIGKMAGEYFNKYFKADIDAGKDINILEFKGDLSTVPTQRSDGFKSTASPKFKILQSFTTNWQRATAMDQMETFLNTSSQADIESVKAVFTHDDEVVLGVLDAIAAYKGAAKLDIRLVSGVGARKENLDTFADFKTKHNIDQVTYAFSPAMIDSAVQLGIDILNGKNPSGQILGPTVEVDNSSAEAFRTNPIYVTRYSLPTP
jgi:ribose transport system substrate-binding protein